MANIMGSVVTNNVNNGNFDNLASSIKINGSSMDQVNNTLKWQHNNMVDIYGYYEIPGVSILNTNIAYCPRAITLVPNILFMVKLPPNNICFRLDNTVDPRWTLISKSGACGELSDAFQELSVMENIPVRTVTIPSIGHAIDEVYINGSWITIDPSIAVLSNYYDGVINNPHMYELPGIEGGWGENVLYAYAQYPNGTMTDVTYRYTNTSRVTIQVLNINNTPLSKINATVDDNPVQHISDENGTIIFDIKTGTHSFNVKNASFSGFITRDINGNSSFNITLTYVGDGGSLENTIYSPLIYKILNYLLDFVLVAIILISILFLIRYAIVKADYLDLIKNVNIPTVIAYVHRK